MVSACASSEECKVKTLFCTKEKYRMYYKNCPCFECLLKVVCSKRCSNRHNLWLTLFEKIHESEYLSYE